MTTPSDPVDRALGCDCLACQMAGQSHRPATYVPAGPRNEGRRRIHGEELRRYWDGRERFFATLRGAAIGRQLTSPSTLIPFRTTRPEEDPGDDAA